MKKSILIITTAAALLSAVFIFSCSPKSPDTAEQEIPKDPEICFDNTFFLGDSNTAHLSHGGYRAIEGMIEKSRVWSGRGSTLTLDVSISVEDPESGEIKSISQIAEEKKPEFLIINLGYNGFSTPPKPDQKTSLDKLFSKAYKKLIGDIKAASPETVIIIQSIYPVKSGRAIPDPESVNTRIDELNGFLRSLAAEEGLKYIDTASVLKDPATNCLKEEYSSGGSFYHADGYHLSDVGLLAVLNYIKENAYK